MANLRVNQVAVLNTIQASAADVVIASGKFKLNDGSADLLEDIKLVDHKQKIITAYAAGTASIREIQTVIGMTVTDGRVWTIEVKKLADLNPFVEDAPNNQGSLTRIYKVALADSSTATQLRAAFIARINADPDRFVNASTSSNDLRLTAIDATADFSIVTNLGLTLANSTPYVAPAGTPAIVDTFVTGQSSPTATYTTYEIVYKIFKRHNAAGGSIVSEEVRTLIFADTGATNYAAFNTELLAVLAGTHTPASDYLGVGT